ncbi:MAG: hypothetical protein V7L23_09605 [Nostoc sp.]|uniref:hypothetical protein n=1 Tax=Nostoc sp. TaxID=1180 RepID=UPI002FEF0BC5
MTHFVKWYNRMAREIAGTISALSLDDPKSPDSDEPVASRANVQVLPIGKERHKFR